MVNSVQQTYHILHSLISSLTSLEIGEPGAALVRKEKEMRCLVSRRSETPKSPISGGTDFDHALVPAK